MKTSKTIFNAFFYLLYPLPLMCSPFFCCSYTQNAKGNFVTTDFTWNSSFNSIYAIDFKRMKQTNTDTSTSRNLRRVETISSSSAS